MSDEYILPKGAIQIFLDELKILLKDSKVVFNLYLREDKPEAYTTKHCLQELQYDKSDIINELLTLKVTNYVGTCDDKRNKKSNKFYIFSKYINNKEIYIKLKIESYDDKIVLCMSFHFAEFHMKRVY